MKTARRSSWEQGIRINYVAPCYVKSAIRTPEYEKSLIDKGVEFGLPEDVASCMMRIATDTEMNGGLITRHDHKGFEVDDRRSLYLDCPTLCGQGRFRRLWAG